MVVLTKRRSDTTEQIYRFFIAISGILHPNPDAQNRKAVTPFGSKIFLTLGRPICLHTNTCAWLATRRFLRSLPWLKLISKKLCALIVTAPKLNSVLQLFTPSHREKALRN